MIRGSDMWWAFRDDELKLTKINNTGTLSCYKGSEVLKIATSARPL